MKQNEYLLLLLKRLSGDISPSESSQLDNWISQSAENARIADEYTLVWNTSGSYTQQFSPNLDADFAKVRARIKADTAAPVLTARRGAFTWVRAAAAVALLVLAVWGYYAVQPANGFNAVAAATTADKQLVALNDGTKVWLRSGSALDYSTSFEGKKERLVQLHGEGYFEVAHDPAHPFRVALPNGGIVEVLGTAFNVQHSEAATTVVVRSGRVKFIPTPGVESPVLTANNKAVFNHSANTLRVSQAATLNELSWQTGKLEFVKTPLSQVVADLEKYYQKKIELQDAAVQGCLHNAIFLTSQSLKDVLDGLAVAYQLQVKETSEGYVLLGGQCR